MLYLLDQTDPTHPFPPVAHAETDPNGLLAVGGDLSPARLLNAYRSGIFPWYSTGQPLLWWSPDPRTILYPEAIRISRSLQKRLRSGVFELSIDREFSQVIRGCAEPRRDHPETWITPEMAAAYEELHRGGHAHSIEVWQGEELVGGLYGVALGCVFYGESMFSRRSNASKAALVWLCRHLHVWGYRVIDCQIHSPHLVSMGAQEVTRGRFIEMLQRWAPQAPAAGAWHPDLRRRTPSDRQPAAVPVPESR